MTMKNLDIDDEDLDMPGFDSKPVVDNAKPGQQQPFHDPFANPKTVDPSSKANMAGSKAQRSVNKSQVQKSTVNTYSADADNTKMSLTQIIKQKREEQGPEAEYDEWTEESSVNQSSALKISFLVLSMCGCGAYFLGYFVSIFDGVSTYQKILFCLSLMLFYLLSLLAQIEPLHGLRRFLYRRCRVLLCKTPALVLQLLLSQVFPYAFETPVQNAGSALVFLGIVFDIGCLIVWIIAAVKEHKQ